MNCGRLFVTLCIGWTSFPTLAQNSAEYFETNIKPILAGRCIQCHSCYNAPCQLNMTSIEGLDRGMIRDYEVFSPRKLRAQEPSRLGIDRKTTQEWRHFSFSHRFMPVTQDAGDVRKNLDTSLILKLIEHKRDHRGLQVDDLANFKEEQAENSRVCADTPARLRAHLSERPSAGMPYGLPALSDDEAAKFKEWTAMGSPRSAKPQSIPAEDLASVRAVENFFKTKPALLSRYLYEHLYLADIYIRNEAAPKTFYKLIRSKSACEVKPDEIATLRSWNDPGMPFFYCLKKVDAILVNKTHLPYRIDQAKLERWQSIFFAQSWSSNKMPPRDDASASNPFVTFREIPVKARYQFLLDDAQYHVATFIKGPVCKGNTAVNSIDEQFYVMFLKPEADLMVRDGNFAAKASAEMILPAYKGSDQFGGIIVGRRIREARNRYRVLRDEAYGKQFQSGYAVSDIWNGDGFNDNAALTVFRHYDSSMVVKGFVGATSKTAFVLDYALFERLVYVLVTGFDVFGDVSHQLHTRLYMSYIRMEAEENFLSFMPASVRQPMRKSWYVPADGITEKIGNAVNALLMRDQDKMSRRYPLLGLDKKTSVDLPELDQQWFYSASADAQETSLRGYRRELMRKVRAHLGAGVVSSDSLNPDKTVLASAGAVGAIGNAQDFEREIAKLTDLRALRSEWVLKLPSVAMLVLETASGPELYTLIRNKEHYNIAWIAGEEARRNLAADTLTVYKGVAGSYPNHIFVVDVRDAQAFLTALIGLTDHASYEALLARYGSPRSGPGSERFWANSDRLHQVFQAKYPLEYGAFDYNRYGIDYRAAKEDTDEFSKNLPSALRDIVTDSLENR